MENFQPPESKTFLQEAQELFQQILNERKAILRPDIKKESVEEALERLLVHWKGLQVETLESRDYESALEAQKIVLSLFLIYKSLLYDQMKTIEEVEVIETDDEVYVVLDAVAEDEVNDSVEATVIIEESLKPVLDIKALDSELERLMNLLEKGPAEDSDMIKSITLSRRLKLQIILLTLCFQSQSRNGEISHKTEQLIVNFSREDIFAAFNKILPRPFNYNLYMKYYAPFLQTFIMTIKTSKLKHLFISVSECFNKQFPQFPLSFDERHGIVMKKLGMESFNLEDCCDRIDTRASVMSFESPIEMTHKMFHIWLLLDASEFLSFDDNFMAIYVFSSDLPVFHEQIMRIFYVINRIDEIVSEIGYTSYSTPKFIDLYVSVYTEMHSLFSKLIRGLSKNYEIYEIESDQITGTISRKTEASAFMVAKLKELAIYLTCPLASLDSILRLSLEVTQIPILFGEEEEKFVFTTQVQSILVLHDFVASDREKFAQYMVELYPCLDRHFSRFHKSKKMESQGPNTALPPSYHLFASKPPNYDNINDSAPEIDLEMQANVDYEDECCGKFCSNICPSLICLLILIITIIYALFNI